MTGRWFKINLDVLEVSVGRKCVLTEPSWGLGLAECSLIMLFYDAITTRLCWFRSAGLGLFTNDKSSILVGTVSRCCCVVMAKSPFVRSLLELLESVGPTCLLCLLSIVLCCTFHTSNEILSLAKLSLKSTSSYILSFSFLITSLKFYSWYELLIILLFDILMALCLCRLIGDFCLKPLSDSITFGGLLNGLAKG